MSVQYSELRAQSYSSVIGEKEPVAHPSNCKNECPYGYDRSFCFPCMAKIMAEHRANKKQPETAQDA